MVKGTNLACVNRITRLSTMYTLIILLLTHNVYALTRVDSLVNTRHGLIRGLMSDNGQYSMFLGIPYATVNHEDPFGAAQPHPNFHQTFDANDDSAVCPQVPDTSSSPIGTLDCLNLNIFVPNAASSQNRLPVMVWIHGGAFSEGSGNREQFQPNFLIKHDVILITINYRLQVFGFMCLGTEEVPGNQGLKDQLLALRWIKDNIESFGGDANKITLFGESAGAMSTHLHILSPSERLFDRAIIQSGVWASPWAIVEPDSSIPIRISKQLGFETDSIRGALSFLSSVDPLLVVGAAEEINTTPISEPFTKPCVERKFEGVDNFITEYSFNASTNKDKIMPIMIGFTNNELLFKFSNRDDEFFSDDFIEVALEFGFKTDDISRMADNIRHFYVGDDTSGETFRDNHVYFGSDFLFNHPTERSVTHYIEDGADEVYRFVFSYDGGRNFLKVARNITSHEASHGDDLGYLFSSNLLPENVGSVEDFLTVDRMTTMWTNFAKFGNPTPQTSDLLPVSWPLFSLNSRYYLDIGSELNVIRSPFHRRMAFWDLFYKVHGNRQIGFEN